jgi:hypothetical protein
MNRQSSAIIGIILIAVGIIALTFGQVLPALGLTGWGFGIWRLWPLLVSAVGLLLVVPPFLNSEKRGLAFLFIPGIPVLATGGILSIASLFNAWGIWEYLWPLEVLAVATGFALAAFFTRKIGLVVPAIIIGANGLLMQFCAITGLWGIWAYMWTIEPLAVGLALFALYTRNRSPGLLKAGLILCGIAGFFLVMMTSILHWSLVSWLGPAVLIGVGLWLLRRQGMLGPSTPEPASEGTAE